MIDVNKTLLETLRKKFGELRYQGRNNSKEFKALLLLLIIHDTLEWGVAVGDKEQTVKKLKQLESSFIVQNGSFDIEYTFDSDPYVNVNTPQNIDTWKRVWDSQNIIDITDTFTPISDIPEGYVPIYEIVLEDIIPDIDTRLIPIYSIILDNIIK